MQQPPSFIDQTNPYFVCKLRKAIYGLKHYNKNCHGWHILSLLKVVYDNIVYLNGQLWHIKLS